MQNIEKRIFEYLYKNLSPKRFEHSYQTAKLSVELALIYGADALKAQTAALLHDCAKSKKDFELISFFDGAKPRFKYFKEIKEYCPQLLHSYAGAVIADKEFGIKDKDILNSIANHTLGRKNMSLLEKILFVADAISYDRTCLKASKTRKLAKINFNGAFKNVMAGKIEYVIASGSWLCPLAVDTWNYYALK
ncbi:MAG: bis(5'-nucleosyl)-tetraphosphatase (symmetrical) YqeK [Endomicrobium sp.]|jgi:predicted HD superfamily hydrolase involved in NAD metabolism|nr:bis(5'-nucleosyl)-tetraphosphatase (symmetrical) YqeK [Endomicrobium sp.]